MTPHTSLAGVRRALRLADAACPAAAAGVAP